ncbi:universal stress protein [Sphaerisporangium rubeum]|uniref:Nucleotide-binding universal stress UspA family protein n=1 Tax=Sphaerisporangium rubeum TaxID=321317 RepID=A0A7X0M465_9ACTN|nr:universal stress protein [Sphaerisporangium rubeum]MBB6470807.1 nucleotide-binding universal stress UspA family protein [Sphaerisporangium rubeum]
MKDVVVGVDGSPASLAAVQWATDDAVRAGVPLRIVFVLNRDPYQLRRFPDPELDDQLTRGAAKVLAEAEQIAHARSGEVDVTTQMLEGAAGEVLRDLAAKAGELVIGTRGMGGFARLVVGSVSMQVAGRAAGAVVVVPHLPDLTKGEVVLGVDDTPECLPALTYAFEQAARRGATLRALHAWEPDVYPFAPDIGYNMEETRIAHQTAVASLLAKARAEYPGVQVIEDVRRAHPVEALASASEGADLLVVGSHGRGPVTATVLGSVSRAVLHHARCPVAVVRPRLDEGGADS